MACARTATTYGWEPPPHSARGVGRRPSGSAPRRVPLVPRRSPQRALHILLRRVRRRVETANRSRLPARKGLPARSRRLRAMRPGHRSPPQGQAQARLRRAPPIREGLGPPPPVGRRPHRACRRRRRRVRPRQHAHALPEVPPRRNTCAVEAPAWRTHFANRVGTRADAWSADPKLTAYAATNRLDKFKPSVPPAETSRPSSAVLIRCSRMRLVSASTSTSGSLQTNASILRSIPMPATHTRNVTANSHYREGARQMTKPAAYFPTTIIENESGTICPRRCPGGGGVNSPVIEKIWFVLVSTVIVRAPSFVCAFCSTSKLVGLFSLMTVSVPSPCELNASIVFGLNPAPSTPLPIGRVVMILPSSAFRITMVAGSWHAANRI